MTPRPVSTTTTYLLKPSELWGVSRGPRAPRVRGAAARQRRQDKRAAKRAGIALKAYLRAGERVRARGLLPPLGLVRT